MTSSVTVCDSSMTTDPREGATVQVPTTHSLTHSQYKYSMDNAMEYGPLLPVGGPIKKRHCYWHFDTQWKPGNSSLWSPGKSTLW